jgi:hypothetical protein
MQAMRTRYEEHVGKPWGLIIACAAFAVLLVVGYVLIS